MQTFIGTKVIKATPMNRQAYNDFRGWQLPADENGADEGYLVEYVDGGKANTEAYQGYVSWSPKDVFERAYRSIDGLTFGGAVEALKLGMKVARQGWNGKGMSLSFVSKSMLPPDHLAYIEMKTVDGKRVPWLASQTDVLAEDWMVVAL